MEGTTGAYPITGHKGQQGMGTWQAAWDAPWMWVEGDGLAYDSFSVWETTEVDAINQWYDETMEWLKANDPKIEKTVRKYPYGVDHHSEGYIGVDFDEAKPGDEEIFGEGYLGTWRLYWTCEDKWQEGFGTYETKAYQGIGNGGIGVDFAFDGMTKDGVSVKYDRFGRNTARSITLNDANIFGTDAAPAKTEIVWSRIVNSDGSVSYYVSNIIATYEEGDYKTIEAFYSSNGEWMQTRVIPADE